MLKRAILCILCALPIMASAQSMHVMIDGGGAWNTKTSEVASSDHNSTIGINVTAGVSIQKNHLEIGTTMSYRHYTLTWGLVNFTRGWGSIPLTKYLESSPCIAVSPFVNYHFSNKKPDWYIGISPDFLTFPRLAKNETDLDQTNRPDDGGYGFGLNVHAGCNYPISSSISTFCEAAGGIAYAPNYFFDRNHIYTVMLNVGFRLAVR